MKLLSSILLLLAAMPLTAATRPFAHQSSDLKPEASLRFGQLPNGLRTVVCRNAEPKGRASLRLVVLAGSLMESESQQGLAHFIEHMAFNGTTHFPPETLVRYFQRLGMGLGDDASAFTYFDRTTFVIDLPDTKTESIAEGLLVLNDYATGIRFETKDIEKERGVILSELRARDSVGLRTSLARSAFLFEGTLLPKRIPIGEAERISAMKREQFLDFYHTWYRPDRMALIAVGDFDPVSVERQLAESFSNLKNPDTPDREPELGQVKSVSGLRIRYYPEREAPSTFVSLSAVHPYVPEKDNRALRVREFARRLAFSMLNQRFVALSLKEGAVFLRAEAGFEGVFRCAREAVVSVECRPEQWEGAVGLAEYELRRALEQGFLEAEFIQAKASFTNRLEQAAKSAATRPSAAVADNLADDLVEHFVSTSPEDDLELFRSVADTLDAKVCGEALRECWTGGTRCLFVTGNAKLPGEAESVLREAYEKSAARKLGKGETLEKVAFDYTDFGPAGKAENVATVQDLDIHQYRFPNGVRLNLKKTDFEADAIRVLVRLGDGHLLEPLDKPGLRLFSSAVFVVGGLKRHGIEDLQRALAGHTLGIDLQVDLDALHFTGVTNRRDLLLQLQLLCAFVREPGYRAEALRLSEKGFEQMYDQIEHQLEGPLSTEVQTLLASGDPSFGYPPREVMRRYTLEDARAFLAPELARAPMEISLVGDLDIDEAVAWVAKTFGALPQRSEERSRAEPRPVRFPDACSRELTVDSRLPKALLCVYWPTTDGFDIKTVRRLGLLSDILRDRLFNKIREDKGEAYTPQSESYNSEVFKNYGYLSAVFPVDPEQVEPLTKTVLELAADLAQKGPSEDELLRARKPQANALRTAQRNNGYWLGNVLSRSQEKPETLDWQRQAEADLEAVSVTELSALAAKYLRPESAVRVSIKPSPVPSPKR